MGNYVKEQHLTTKKCCMANILSLTQRRPEQSWKMSQRGPGQR